MIKPCYNSGSSIKERTCFHMVETRLLYYFLTVAKEQNITKAAQSLYITQSALSKQMMELERQLGKQLFIRGKRKLTLTDEGDYLCARAAEILKLIDTTEAALQSSDDILTGEIAIGGGETSVVGFIAQKMAQFHKQYPHVKFHMHSGDSDVVLDKLDKGLIDMGITPGPVRYEKYEYRNLNQKIAFGLLMPADCALAAQETVHIDSLKGQPLILAEQTFSRYRQLDLFSPIIEHVNPVATYNLITNATYMVESGIGYALCLEHLVNVEGRNLTFRRIEPEKWIDQYLVTRRYQTFSPAAKRFLEMF